MTNITLQKQHRTLWHFIPGLALSAVGDGFRQHHLSAHLEKL